MRDMPGDGKAPGKRTNVMPDPGAWHELADAYHTHHFKCPTCQAAGRGIRYGLRCGTGAALWSGYTMPGKVAL